MAGVFKRIIEENALLDGTYVEPFVGGGSVALSLLLNDYVSRIVINDKDRSIYAFWHSVLNDAERLCRAIADTAVNMDVWRRQKAVQAEKLDPYEHKLLGITAMTKLLGRTRFDELLGQFIEKPQGKPALVPLSDKRPPMNSAAEDFDIPF